MAYTNSPLENPNSNHPNLQLDHSVGHSVSPLSLLQALKNRSTIAQIPLPKPETDLGKNPNNQIQTKLSVETNLPPKLDEFKLNPPFEKDVKTIEEEEKKPVAAYLTPITTPPEEVRPKGENNIQPFQGLRTPRTFAQPEPISKMQEIKKHDNLSQFLRGGVQPNEASNVEKTLLTSLF